MKTTLLVTMLLGGLIMTAGCGDDRPAQETAANTPANTPAPQPAQGPEAMQMPGGHPPVSPGADIDLSNIAPADGGKTVAQVWAERQALAGSEVAVRGRVVKFSPSIMGRNWVHLRDGTGDDGTNDLTVTTQSTVAVGDLVTVRGTIAADRDFGAGYRYGVIMEDATVSLD